MYTVKEISIADTRRMFGYVLEDVYGAKLNIKGFDYAWLMSSRDWKAAERVLDVGAGYSHLPLHLANDIGCEVWCADDFGLMSGDEFWTRGDDPTAFAKQHPEVNYVLERLGDATQSSLPHRYFDVVYSASALEHVPLQNMIEVWQHMDFLLKPGGELMHAVDIRLPTWHGLRSVLKALALDLMYPVLPPALRTKYSLHTPTAYMRTVAEALELDRGDKRPNLNVVGFVLDPEVVIEPFEATYNRITRDGLAEMSHLRVGSLLIHLRKHA
jgi:SAM-dependent methyltransferase